METADVIVAGGGIIGLSVALELARNGWRVRVLERGRAMAEASWAAAGMLAADDPEHPSQLIALARLSGQLYPGYLKTIESLSRLPVPLRTRATLLVGTGAPADAIDSAEAARRVPGLVTDDRRFFWMEEASLDPRDLGKALPAAAVAAGVDIQLNTSVSAVHSDGKGVVVSTGTGATLHSGAFINCCGAWAGEVRYEALQAPPPAVVEPRKGQMLTVQLPGPVDLPCVIRTREIYLVPRGGGQVVIGATVERAGYDRTLDPQALGSLRHLAAAVWPPIASGTVSDSWSGLRPGTPDDLPIIGGAGLPGCWVATGHFRNGILLAPATAFVVRQLLAGAEPVIDLAAFAPGRASGKSSEPLYSSPGKY